MAKNRIVYLDILIVAAALCLAFDMYIFQVLLIVALILPIISFLFLIPVRYCIFCRIEMVDDMVPKGACPLKMTLENKGFIPCINGEILLVCSNALGRKAGEIPARRDASTIFSAGAKSKSILPLEIVLDECGRIDLYIDKVYAHDLLGLFKIPVNKKNCICDTEYIYVLPETMLCSVHTEKIADMNLDSDTYSKKKSGSDPFEIFNLRDYIAGDSFHSIHWKLSERMQRLIVKEYGLPLSANVHFLLELHENSTPAEKDILLGTLLSFSEDLISSSITHMISWVDANGLLRTERITDTETLGATLHELLAMPAAETFSTLRSFSYQDPFVHQIHLVYMFGGKLHASSLNDETLTCLSMLLDNNLCGRVTFMPAWCDRSSAEKILASGTDIQLLNGDVPEENEGNDGK